MTLYPWAHPGEFVTTASAEPQVLLANIVPALRSAWIADTHAKCRLCEAEHETPFHLLSSCSHPHVIQQRSRIHMSATQLIVQLLQLLRREHITFWGEDASVDVKARVDSALSVATDRTFSWYSTDGRTLLPRLLAAAPYSAFDVRATVDRMAQHRRSIQRDAQAPVSNDHAPLTHAIGAVLDAITLPRARLRPYANAWVRWSHKTTHMLAGIHACARGNLRPEMPCPCRSSAHLAPDMLDIPEPSCLDGSDAGVRFIRHHDHAALQPQPYL